MPENRLDVAAQLPFHESLPFQPYPAVPEWGSIVTGGTVAINNDGQSCGHVHGDRRELLLCWLRHQLKLRRRDRTNPQRSFHLYVCMVMHADSRSVGAVWDDSKPHWTWLDHKDLHANGMTTLREASTRKHRVFESNANIRRLIAVVEAMLAGRPLKEPRVWVHSPGAEEIAVQVAAHEIRERLGAEAAQNDDEYERHTKEALRLRWEASENKETTPSELARQLAVGKAA